MCVDSPFAVFKDLAIKLNLEMYNKDNEDKDDFINKLAKQIEQDRIKKLSVKKASEDDFNSLENN